MLTTDVNVSNYYVPTSLNMILISRQNMAMSYLHTSLKERNRTKLQFRNVSRMKSKLD